MTKLKRLSADEILESLLNEDEEILWLGQPSLFRLLSIDDLLLIPFSLGFGAFTIDWMLSVFYGGVYPFLCYGIPLTLLGQYLIWGRFIYDYLNRRHTYYVITENRIIIFSAWFAREIQSIYLETVSELNIRFGTIYFNQASAPGVRAANRLRYPLDALRAISDAEKVYRLLQEQIHYLKH